MRARKAGRPPCSGIPFSVFYARVVAAVPHKTTVPRSSLRNPFWGARRVDSITELLDRKRRVLEGGFLETSRQSCCPG